MKSFKFFQKPVKGDLTMMDGQTYITASHNMFTQGIIGVTGSPGTTGSPGINIPEHADWDTPEGHNYRRMLYHINPAEYERQRQIREDLRARLRTAHVTEEERLRIRHQAFQRMRNTNDDMERYFIENGFRDLNDNPVEPPVIKPKSKISKFTDWCLNNADMILYGVGVFFALSVIATFMIYFK